MAVKDKHLDLAQDFGTLGNGWSVSGAEVTLDTPVAELVHKCVDSKLGVSLEHTEAVINGLNDFQPAWQVAAGSACTAALQADDSLQRTSARTAVGPVTYEVVVNRVGAVTIPGNKVTGEPAKQVEVAGKTTLAITATSGATSKHVRKHIQGLWTK